MKFEVGKLYTWNPIYEAEYIEFYVVWKSNRKDIWKINVANNTSELNQKSIFTVLECYRTKNYYDLKILTTCGICGWIRIGKEFHDDWQPVSV